jgi:hypothetical protein
MLGEISHQKLKVKSTLQDREDACQKSTITTIGILTCHRPEALHRCVSSFLDNCRVYGRKPRIFVTDDSVQSSQRAANIASLERVSRSNPEIHFSHGGLTEKRHYSRLLALRSAVDPAIIEFALFNPENLSKKACGPNRNALFLETVGESFLSIDDDVVCRPSINPDSCQKPEVNSAKDPTQVLIFQDRPTLLSQRPEQTIDMLALHENLLAKRLDQLLRSAPESPVTFGKLSPSLLRRLQQKSPDVRVSWTGIYGDSGARYPTHYLWKDESTYRQLVTSEEIYRRLSISREIFRAPRSVTLGYGGYCQSTALAYEHATVLPPYMPLRGLDIIFGKTFIKCFRDSLIGYHPWALLHDPPEARSNTSEDIRKCGRAIPYYEILQGLIETYPAPEYGSDAAKSLEELGAHLHMISQLSTGEFEEILSRQFCKKVTRRIEGLTHQIQTHSAAPPYWSRDIEAYIQVLKKTLTPAGHRAAILAEESDLPAEARLALAQRLTARFGRLLQAWPALIEAARELKSSGISLARPLSTKSQVSS